MPSKGTFTAASAAKQGLIAAAPIGRVINQWATENWWMDAHGAEGSKADEVGTTARLAEFTGIHFDVITRVRNGRKEWLEFDSADKIVTFINPMLWMTDPELRELYENYDLSSLDLNRPTCSEVIEEFVALSRTMTQRRLGAIYGVSQSTVYRVLERETVAA